MRKVASKHQRLWSWLIVAGPALAGVLGLAAFFVARPPLPGDETLPLLACEPPAGAGLVVTYGGVATLKVSDGTSDLLTDGYFSRGVSAFDALLDRSIAPDPEAIDRAITHFGLVDLDALLIGHSHFDHALDAGLLARKTGADLIGSPSALMIGRGAGLGEARLIDATKLAQTGRCYGALCVRFLPSRHLNYPYGFNHNPGRISKPLVPPAPFSAYRAGATYMIEIRHARHGSILIANSANYIPASLDGVDVDILFLGLGGLGRKGREPYIEPFFAAILKTRPELIVPIHFDDIFSDPAKPRLMSRIADHLKRSLSILRAMTDIPIGRLAYGVPALMLRDGKPLCLN